MKYRSKTDIISMILESASAGATKTKIMYKAFISYSQSLWYLKFLLENGLLTFESETQLYKLTEKGRKYLHTCNEISEMITQVKESPESYMRLNKRIKSGS